MRSVPADITRYATEFRNVDFLNPFDDGLECLRIEELDCLRGYTGEEAAFEGFELRTDRYVCEPANVIADVVVAVGVCNQRGVFGVGGGGGKKGGELRPGCRGDHLARDGLSELFDAEFIGACEDIFDRAFGFVPFEEGGETAGKDWPSVCDVVEFSDFFVKELAV